MSEKTLCPECQLPFSRVLDTRGDRRRRQCENPNCGARFSTREVLVISTEPRHRLRYQYPTLF